jgi:hypothetical protein
MLVLIYTDLRLRVGRNTLRYCAPPFFRHRPETTVKFIEIRGEKPSLDEARIFGKMLTKVRFASTGLR